jgi:hypothetical protein
LLPDGTMEERCNFFAVQGIKDPNWAFRNIISFLQFQKERVQKEEITGATLRNFVKSIKLFWYHLDNIDGVRYCSTCQCFFNTRLRYRSKKYL